MVTRLALLGLLLAAPTTPLSARPTANETIPAVAVSSGRLKTLVAAVTEAGLAGALSGEGPFTVFAPTDEAFAKLPEGTVASLLEPRNRETLVRILKHHVVAGRLDAADLVGRRDRRRPRVERGGASHRPRAHAAEAGRPAHDPP